MKAIIFDLDGTIIANEKAYGEAFGSLLSEMGAKDLPSYPHIGGIGVEENWPILLKKYNVSSDKSANWLSNETQSRYLSKLESIEFKKGYEDYFAKVKQSGLRTALATSNYTDATKKVLEFLGIENAFDAVVTGDMVKTKKPDPEIFLKASNLLGVASNECLVIEDSVAGVEAAINAGMHVVGIYRDAAHAKELKAAKILIKDFNDTLLWKVTNQAS